MHTPRRKWAQNASDRAGRVRTSTASLSGQFATRFFRCVKESRTFLKRDLFLRSSLQSALCASSIVSASSCFWTSGDLPAGSANRTQRSSAITSIRLETERFSKDAICSSLFHCSLRTVRLSFGLLLFFLDFAIRSFYTSFLQ